jgi:hypothetical protein
MKRMRTPFAMLLAGVVLSVAVLPAAAQPGTNCPAIVEEALAVLDGACADTGRNEACYGFTLVDARDSDDDPLPDFAQSGDITAIDQLASLTTTPLNEETGTWGVAMLRLQANLPDTLPGQNVTFIVLGDTEIASDAEAAGDDFDAPLQAFRMSTGIGQPACAEVPRDGLLVQSPAGVEVSFRVNGVDVDMGSTGFFSSTETGGLEVTTLEGGIAATAEGETVEIPAGFWTTIEPGEAPGEPTEMNPQNFSAAPVDLLPEPFNVPVPVTVVPSAGWIDTGIAIAAGQTVAIGAGGQINLWPDCTPDASPERPCSVYTTGPDGIPDFGNQPIIVDALVAALVARVGDGAPFAVGSGAVIVTSDEGNLWLRINDGDDVIGDDTGAFLVAVFVTPLEDAVSPPGPGNDTGSDDDTDDDDDGDDDDGD